jgi:hypothetical protein
VSKITEKNDGKCGNDTGRKSAKLVSWVRHSPPARRAKRTHPRRFFSTSDVMEFPPTWRVFLDKEFEAAQPQIEGATTMELMVQVRHTGRMLSNFRIGLGGEARIKEDVDLGAMVPRDTFRGWRFRTQYWARDVKIRTNMTSSVWFDLEDAIAAKDGTVIDDNGAEIPGREVLRLLDELQDDSKTAAFRWVVAVGEDNLMKLQLQSLPGPAVLIAGKPTLRQ